MQMKFLVFCQVILVMPQKSSIYSQTTSN